MGENRVRLAFALAAGVWAALSSGGAGATPPLEAYGRLPNVQHVNLSADGQYIALVARGETGSQVQVRRTSDLGMVVAVPTGTVKVRDIEWAGPRHLIIVKSNTAQIVDLDGARQEWSMALDLNVVTKKLAPLMNDQEGALNTIFGNPQIVDLNGKPTAFLIGMTFPGGPGVLTLYRQDLDSGAIHQIAVGSEATRDWLIDRQGKIAARVDYHEANGDWVLAKTAGNRTIRTTALLDPPSLEGYLPDGQTLLIGTQGENGSQYRTVGAGADHWSEPLAPLNGDGLVFDTASRIVLAATDEKTDSIDYNFFAPADKALWAAVRRAFPHDVAQLASWSDDRSKLILQIEGQSGASYFLLDTKARRASWIADEYAGITADDIAEVRAISYKAQDGTILPAYLTLPRGADPHGLPLVVLVHGGPAARDDPGFDWWPQALASRGYAVLQPEYRGSAGFTQGLMTAGFGQWGRKMQTDISDGVADLVASHTVDPARVCIVGGSYGGYAALAGVTLQSNVYRCAASLAGPADLRQFLSWEESVHGGSRNETLRYWQRFMGARTASDPVLDTISPLHFADHVHVPVLLMHGLDDTVVPYAQSKAMADALKQAGANVSLVTLKSEDHWLSRSETRLEMLRSLADFLDKNLPVTNATGGATAMAVATAAH